MTTNWRAQAACIVVCAVATAGCDRSRGAIQRAAEGDATATTATGSASAPSPGAADGPDGAVHRALVPAGGRIFFGKSISQTEAIATDELLFVPTANGVRVVLRYKDLTGTLDGLGHVQTAKAGGETYSLTLYADGSFDGVRTNEDGSKGTWIRTPFRPFAPEQLAVRVGFEGFVAENVRYRMKVSLRGDEIGRRPELC